MTNIMAGLVTLAWPLFVMHAVAAQALTTRFNKNVTTVEAWGVVGGAAFLPCPVEAPPPDRVVLILWYRAVSDTPIYSVDARDGQLAHAGHWSAEFAFGRRATFVISPPPSPSSSMPSPLNPSSSGLIIEGLHDTDAGVYRCRVDFRQAQTRNSYVSLSVTVPPGPPIIKNKDGTIVPSVAGPYLEGEILELFCESRGARPTPSLLWFRDGELWDSSYHEMEGMKDSSTFTYATNDVVLQRLRRTDLNTILSCEASNNNLTLPSSSFVLVDMLLVPLDVRLTDGESSLLAHKDAIFTCVSAGSRPPAMVTWYLNGRRLPGSLDTISHNGNSTTSSITLSPSPKDGGAVLTCRAENVRLPVPPLETHVRLEVLYAPQVDLDLKPPSEETTEGDSIVMTCRIDAHPPHTRIEWRHNGRVVKTNDKNIVFHQISRSNAGNYECRTANSQGEGNSPIVNLHVNYRPVCRSNTSTVYYVQKGELVGIKCEVLSQPPPVYYKWSINSTVGVRTLDVPIESAEILHFMPTYSYDYGQITCVGGNSVGEQKSPCVFDIKPAGPPDRVSSCSIHNASTHSLTLVCIPPSSTPSLTVLYSLAIWEASANVPALPMNLANVTSAPELPIPPVGMIPFRNVSSVTPRFLIMGLQPGKEYRAVVTTANAKGRSAPFHLTIQTLTEPRGQPTISDTEFSRPLLVWTPTIVTVVGVATALLLLAILMGIVFRSRCQARSRSRPIMLGKGEQIDMQIMDAEWEVKSNRRKATSSSVRENGLLKGAVGDEVSEAPLMALAVIETPKPPVVVQSSPSEEVECTGASSSQWVFGVSPAIRWNSLNRPQRQQQSQNVAAECWVDHVTDAGKSVL